MHRCILLDRLQQDETIVEKVVGGKVQPPVNRHAPAPVVPRHRPAGVQSECVHVARVDFVPWYGL
jgi:hypothetical protein